MHDIISIGATTVDIFIKSDGFLVKDNLLSVEYASKNEISQSLICSGGGASNAAVSFSRLGLKTACISLIGESHLNNFIRRDFEENGLSLDYLSKDKKDTTDFSVILVAPDGGRSILTNRGKSGLTKKYIPWKTLKLAKWLYITSLEGNLDLLEQIIGFAKESNIKVSINPGSRELTQQKRLLPLLPLVDFLLLNQEEAETITQTDHDNSHFWDNIHRLNTPLVAVTNGREGAHILLDGKQFYSPIINTHPVDETGAGDSFGSAFVAALIHQKTPQEALFWGIKNSASVVSYLGAKTGLLTLKQISK